MRRARRAHGIFIDGCKQPALAQTRLIAEHGEVHLIDSPIPRGAIPRGDGQCRSCGHLAARHRRLDLTGSGSDGAGRPRRWCPTASAISDLEPERNALTGAERRRAVYCPSARRRRLACTPDLASGRATAAPARFTQAAEPGAFHALLAQAIAMSGRDIALTGVPRAAAPPLPAACSGNANAPWPCSSRCRRCRCRAACGRSGCSASLLSRRNGTSARDGNAPSQQRDGSVHTPLKWMRSARRPAQASAGLLRINPALADATLVIKHNAAR